jgi:catechol 2,3-dioxygenase-like lactoylglutathione lyase family enzyme
MVRATAVDHYVLTVADVEATVAWYASHLGLEVLRLEEWRRKEVLFVSLRINEGTLIDVMAGARTGENVNHVALRVDDTDLDALATSGDFDVVMGPADLFGARGQGRGLYVRDPAGNVVELRNYPSGA